jgi:hypothetical protein
VVAVVEVEVVEWKDCREALADSGRAWRMMMMTTTTTEVVVVTWMILPWYLSRNEDTNHDHWYCPLH